MFFRLYLPWKPVWTGIPTVLMVLMVLAPWYVQLASGQSFFAESEALRAGSAFSLTLSTLDQNASTETPLGPDRTITDSSLTRVKGRYRLGFFGFGGMGETRDLEEHTEAFFRRDDRVQKAGYLALVFDGLFFEESGLLIVASQSSRTQEFVFQTFQRTLNSKVTGQTGIILRLGPLVAGYIQGGEELSLAIEDPAGTSAMETFKFEFQARVAGLILGSLNDFGITLLWQRKETPAVSGTNIDLEEGFEELRRALIALGVFRVEASETLFREVFSGDSFRESREREVSLGLRVTQNIVIAITDKRTFDVQGFTLLGAPSVDRTERVEKLFTFRLFF